MKYEELIDSINKLSLAEKILLVEDIWDSIVSENAEIPLSDEQKKELDKRYENFKKYPGSSKKWEEIKRDIQAKM